MYAEGGEKICETEINNDISLEIEYENFNLDNPRRHITYIKFKDSEWHYIDASIRLANIRVENDIPRDNPGQMPKYCDLAKDAFIYDYENKLAIINSHVSFNEGKSFENDFRKSYEKLILKEDSNLINNYSYNLPETEYLYLRLNRRATWIENGQVYMLVEQSYFGEQEYSHEFIFSTDSINWSIEEIDSRKYL